MSETEAIPFADYQHDMDELGDRGAAIIGSLRRDRDERDMLIRALVAAAGGTIAVLIGDMADARRGDLVVGEQQDPWTKTFRIRPAPSR